MFNKKLNQTGFGAVVAVLIIVIIGLIAVLGFYIWRHNQPIDQTSIAKPQKNLTAQKSTQILKLDKAKAPTGWKVSSNDTTAISLTYDGGNKAKLYNVVSATYTIKKSLNTNNAKAFIAEQIADLRKTAFVGKPLNLQIQTPSGAQTVTAYPAAVKEKFDDNYNSRTAFIVGNGYYVQIIEFCHSASQLTEADQALQAITFKL